MSILVSGILKSPAGAVIAGAQITLTALTTSPDLLAGVSASAVTIDTGYYGMNVLPGAYSLTVAVNGKSQVYGSFRLDGTETTVTLNMVLRRNLVEVSIPGELLTGFRQIQNNVADDLEAMRQLKSGALVSADSAGKSATDAKSSAEAAASSEANAANSESAAAQSAKDLQDAVAKAEESSSDAEKQAVSASGSADTAKQAATTAANDAALLTADKIRSEVANHADSASQSALNASDAKDAAEKAASNAALSENNAAGSATDAAASDASAKRSTENAQTSEQAAKLSETNAGKSAVTATSAAATATTAAGTATDAAQQAATSEQNASQSEKNAAASEVSATQAARDSTAARDEVVSKVTGFDAHVSQQTDIITKAAHDATTKADSDITAAGETVKQVIQTQGQHFVDSAHTEATSASQSAQDAQTASHAAQQANVDAQTALNDTMTAKQSAKDAESNALKASQEAQDAAKTAVTTDGTTITGDGKGTPLSLARPEPYAVGTYTLCTFNGSSLYDNVNDPALIKGENVGNGDFINTIAPGTWLRVCQVDGSISAYNPPGTWISCSSNYNSGGSDIRGIWRRIA
ncbi:TPA: carboxypeptidase regulatory-like domain-containing protein [Salmonella enterica subsp. enterica serovar Kodjovi]|nr:carboxypeptidase regulatory-like domain-containing protein [Salmonella enterica subsp. enterica serovar Kodjovi]